MTNGLRPSGSSPTADTPSYDLVVLGSGPGGQKAAIAAAKLGKSVAVVERDNMLGGVCTNTGTIPSKTLREAVLYLTGMNQRELYGASYRVKANITPEDLLARQRTLSCTLSTAAVKAWSRSTASGSVP
ncbi:Probable soluble pyridine nucleotide transhydrogenase [Mycobacteroides abscessus]|nr:Probable soluble pyridine nucleotide transhydrogenase [Mycobacteroides abscessus]